jgi:hypothetical protein
MSKRDRQKERRLRNHYKARRAERRRFERNLEYIRFMRQGLQVGEPLSEELYQQRNKEWEEVHVK